jgi:NAD(P)-dependent dehydrogenase (short-subunit alcohol dehydrogenase family)
VFQYRVVGHLRIVRCEFLVALRTVRVVDSQSLAGRVACITGAASGQGRAAAELFAAHGARIAIVDIDDEGSKETAAHIESAGGEAMVVHADVSRRDGCETMVDATVDGFGRLDVLYNNAAIQMSGRLVETTEAMWDITIATNLTAIFRACKAAIPHMLRAGSGSIINTSSTLGQQGSEGYAAYGAAKAGLIALTRQIAVEYGPPIRANVIAPGSIDTPRFRRVTERMDDAASFLDMLERTIPLRRLGVADDVAQVALFLGSDASAYTSGAVIPCDGGLAAYR